MARSKVRIVCAIGFLCAVSLSAQEVVRDTITGKVHQIEKVTVTARRLPNRSSYSPYGIADSQSQLLVACDYLERWSSSIALQPDLRSAR